jgi:hypothetical protein
LLAYGYASVGRGTSPASGAAVAASPEDNAASAAEPADTEPDGLQFEDA